MRFDKFTDQIRNVYCLYEKRALFYFELKINKKNTNMR